MTLSKLLSELRTVHVRPDLAIQLVWDGAEQWSASIPGYIVIDLTAKSVTSTLSIGKTPREALERMATQLRGRTLQIQNSTQRPYLVPAGLELGPVSF
jgi:hypothetical protein